MRYHARNATRPPAERAVRLVLETSLFTKCGAVSAPRGSNPAPTPPGRQGWPDKAGPRCPVQRLMDGAAASGGSRLAADGLERFGWP